MRIIVSSRWASASVDDERTLRRLLLCRYDIVHLLEQLPEGAFLLSPKEKVQQVPRETGSPTGMSDLPSDTEDVFFMEADEAEEYQRQKQRRLLDALRTSRIDAMKAQEAVEEQKVARQDSVAEPLRPVHLISQSQLNLMKRTSQALRRAANRAALEMRILANHGNDERFNFLRAGNGVGKGAASGGQTGKVWERLMAGFDISLEEANDEGPSGGTAAGHSTELVGYASSTESDTSEQQASPPSQRYDEESPEARRKRKLALAQEWSRKRKARLEGSEEVTGSKSNGKSTTEQSKASL